MPPAGQYPHRCRERLLAVGVQGGDAGSLSFGFVAHVTFWQREKYEDMLATYSIAYRTP